MYEELSALLAVIALYILVSDSRRNPPPSSGRPFDRHGVREVRPYTTRFGGLPGPLRSQASIDEEVRNNDLDGYGSYTSGFGYKKPL